MSLTLTSTFSLKTTYSQIDSQQGARYTDITAINFVSGFANGNSTGQNNVLWHDNRVLPSTGERLDLFALSRQMFSGSYDVNFSGAAIRAVTVLNSTTGNGRDLAIHGSNAGDWGYPFGGSTGLMVKDQTPLNLINLRNDWLCNTGSRYLNVVDVQGTGGLSYTIGIVGAK